MVAPNRKDHAPARAPIAWSEERARVSHDSAYVASFIEQVPRPVLAVGSRPDVVADVIATAAAAVLDGARVPRQGGRHGRGPVDGRARGRAIAATSG